MTRMIFKILLPFTDNNDREEIATYLTNNGGFTYVSCTRGLDATSLGVTVLEDLTEQQKSALQAVAESTGGKLQFVDNF